MAFNMTWANDSLGAPLYISISKLGISLNVAAIEELKKPREVIIGFDEEERVLGVLPVNNSVPEEAKTYTLCTQEREGSTWIRIGCKGFIRYLEKKTGRDFSKSYRSEAKIEGGMLIIKL